MAAIVDRLEQALEGHGARAETSEFCPEDVCSFCITGATPRYQAIYQCSTCIKARRKQALGSKDTFSSLCIGCSKGCHRGHKVELVGYSNGYCDCGAAGCKLALETSANYSVPITSTESNLRLTDNRLPFTAHQFRAQSSDGDIGTTFSKLREECMAIVCESKETFWVAADWEFSSAANVGPEKTKCRCELEDLALMVFRYHTEKASGASSSSKSGTSVAGAEWWIQIKNLESTESSSSAAASEGAQEKPKDPSIELHYDKDEGVAEDWGVGVYPTLSTVTYLSASAPGSRFLPQQPTVVYANTTEDEVGAPISDCYISFPKVGKHVCFDGSLLHGAPSDKALARWEWEFNGIIDTGGNSSGGSSSSSGGSGSGAVERFRFTFLVNVWLDHHPASVLPLPDAVLAQMQAATAVTDADSEPITDAVSLGPAAAGSVVEVSVADEEALKPDTYELGSDSDAEDEEEEGAPLMERIRDGYQVLYIPFIPAPEEREGEQEQAGEAGSGSDDEDDAECGLSLRMILPPVAARRGAGAADRHHDCFHIHYEDECSAVLEYI